MGNPEVCRGGLFRIHINIKRTRKKDREKEEKEDDRRGGEEDDGDVEEYVPSDLEKKRTWKRRKRAQVKEKGKKRD